MVNILKNEKLTRTQKSSENSKQENDEGINLRRLGEIPEIYGEFYSVVCTNTV